MQQTLMTLLEYRVVLGALVTTLDGLVVAHAGLSSSDTEFLAAASSSQSGDDQFSLVETRGGTLLVLRGKDMRLVVLADIAAPIQPIVALMQEQIDVLEEAIAV
jgi:predicted regulator of Ras-like GTPase activity (Roadblock/LC7/MglB family)